MTTTDTLLYPSLRDLAQSRRSWLGYTEEPVEPAVIEELVAVAYGLATRPMVRFDPVALAALVDVPPAWVPVTSMLIGHQSQPTMEATDRKPATEVLGFL